MGYGIVSNLQNGENYPDEMKHEELYKTIQGVFYFQVKRMGIILK